MDRRFWSFCFVAVSLSSSVGCSLFEKKTVLPNLPAAPVTANTPKSVSITEPTDTVTVKKEGPLDPKTMVIYANNIVEVVARDPSKSPSERERMLTDARNNYNEALRREPNNLDALLGLGSIYQVTGETDQLAAIEARATKLHPKDAKVWNWIAIRQGRAKDWENAAKSLHKATECDPDNRMYRSQLGVVLARGKRYDEGFEWLRRSMRTHDAHYVLAEMAYHNGDDGRAVEELRKCLQLEPKATHAQEMLTHISSPQHKNVQPVSGQGSPTSNVRPAYHNEPQPIITNGRLNGAPLMQDYTPTSGWDGSSRIAK